MAGVTVRYPFGLVLDSHLSDASHAQNPFGVMIRLVSLLDVEGASSDMQGTGLTEWPNGRIMSHARWHGPRSLHLQLLALVAEAVA